MKTFEQFNETDEKEELFHLNELEIKFDLIEYDDNLFYFYKGKNLFDQDKKSKYFFINNKEIWSVFESKFHLNYQEISVFMVGMVEKHFKLKGYTPWSWRLHWTLPVEKHFKLKGYTPWSWRLHWTLPVEKHFKLKGYTPYFL